MNNRLLGLGLAWLVAIAVVLLSTFYLSPLALGELEGPDPYTCLSRLLYNWSSGDWSNANYPRSNWPFGEMIQWTQALDVIIMGFAIPLEPFVGMHKALLIAGAVSGPFLYLVAAATAIWASLVVLPSLGRRWVGLFFVLQPWAVFAFMPWRPDHHGLQLVVWMGLFGVCARMVVTGYPGARLPITGGLLFATGLWISVEQLVTAVPCCLALALAWVVRGRPWARANTLFWSTAAALLVFLLLMDGPAEGILSVQYDRFSTVHVALLGAIAVFWFLVAKFDGSTQWITRFWHGFGGAAIVAALMWFLFSEFYRGAFASTDPGIWPIFIEGNADWESLLSGRKGYIGPFVIHLLLPLGAFVLYLWRRRDNPSVIGFIALSHLWFFGLVLMQLRWNYYLTFLNATALAMAVGLVLMQIDKLPPGRAGIGSLKAITVYSAAICSYILAGVGTALMPSVPYGRAECSGQEAVVALQKESPGVVLADLYWGPRLLWDTNFAVIATPMHRNSQGILYSHQVMTSSDPSIARRLLAQRQVTHLIWCEGQPWVPTVLQGSPGTFYADLQTNHLPDWLTLVPMDNTVLKIARVSWTTGQAIHHDDGQ